MSSQSQSVQVLSASVPDVRYLSSLLRGINFASRATVTITENGLTITVEEARTLLAITYVFRDMFEEFDYHPEPPRAGSQQSEDQNQEGGDGTTTFEIPLNTLIECMNIFGSSGISGSSKARKWKKNGYEDGGPDNDDDRRTGPLHSFFSSDKGTAMRMSYNGSGHPLTLFVAEDASGPTATCEIITYEPEPHIEVPFDQDSIVVLKVILKSSWLRDALSELDLSYDKITIIGNPSPSISRSRSARGPDKPLLRIQAAGTFGSTEMDYPNDKEVLESFDCSGSVSFTYKFAHISRSIRALQNSSRTSLRIDNEGILCFQLLMPSPTPKGGISEAFTEFRCLPLDVDE